MSQCKIGWGDLGQQGGPWPRRRVQRQERLQKDRDMLWPSLPLDATTPDRAAQKNTFFFFRIFFFLRGPFLKSLLNLVQHCFHFLFCVFWPPGMWDCREPPGCTQSVTRSHNNKETCKAALPLEVVPGARYVPGIWDLSSLTRDHTLDPCLGRPSLNHWTAR